jgi:hypothetical protein
MWLQLCLDSIKARNLVILFKEPSAIPFSSSEILSMKRLALAQYINHFSENSGACRSTVVEALSYKLDGCGFNT